MIGWKTQLQLGAALLLFAVLLGAFGAHALKDVLDDYGVSLWRKASLYHFVHGLGLLILGVLARTLAPEARGWSLAALFFILGVVLFSGSLYAYALIRIGWLVVLTPLGGVAFILGWCTFLWCLSRQPSA